MDQLEFEVTDIESVPEAVRGFYESKDGKHVLKVKGAVSKSKLDEFRNTNIDLTNKVKKMEPVIALLGEDGLTPEKLEQKLSALAEGRVKEMKDNYETQVSTLTSEKSGLEQRFKSLVLNDQVTKKALKHGVIESALEDVIFRASTVFDVDTDGKVKAKDGKVNKKGEALSVEDWLTGLAESAKHLFGQSMGGGATTPAGSTTQPALSANEKIAAGLRKQGILK